VLSAAERKLKNLILVKGIRFFYVRTTALLKNTEYCTFIQYSDNLRLSQQKHGWRQSIKQIRLGVFEMKCIQKWFEVMAGISQEEQARWALAQEIYGRPATDMSALKMPACWRRQVRIH
jgi:hypothetical protein